MKVKLRHDSGAVKTVKKGFSWTFLFFGLFVPLIRGDLKWTAIIFCLQVLLGSFTFGIGSVIVSFIFSFSYNKIYIKELMEKGYVPTEEFYDIVNNYVN